MDFAVRSEVIASFVKVLARRVVSKLPNSYRTATQVPSIVLHLEDPGGVKWSLSCFALGPQLSISHTYTSYTSVLHLKVPFRELISLKTGERTAFL